MTTDETTTSAAHSTRRERLQARISEIQQEIRALDEAEARARAEREDRERQLLGRVVHRALREGDDTLRAAVRSALRRRPPGKRHTALLANLGLTEPAPVGTAGAGSRPGPAASTENEAA